MKAAKRRQLEQAGWRVGSYADFLELTPEEVDFVEIKGALVDCVRETRRKRGWTQEALAERLESSQSRVAKLEAGDGAVSLDLLLRAVLALGVSRRDLAKVIAS